MGKRKLSSRAKRKKFMRAERKKFYEAWVKVMADQPPNPFGPFKYETRLKMEDKIEVIITNQNK